jgi:hypothetical protein
MRAALSSWVGTRGSDIVDLIEQKKWVDLKFL